MIIKKIILHPWLWGYVVLLFYKRYVSLNLFSVDARGEDSMPFITISQRIGSGGEAIARLVADGLDLKLFDDDSLQQEALKRGIRHDGIENFDDKIPGLFDRLLSKKPKIYLNYLESIVYELAKEGEGVFIGHGSQILLRKFGCALHVQIHAGEALRIDNLMKQRQVSRDVAQNFVQKADHEQDGFFHYAFHKDWKDESLYDFVINTQKIDYELASRMIIDAYQYSITACSLDALDMIDELSLKREINAVLLKNSIQTKWLDIEVHAKGMVAITGYIYSQEEKDKLLTSIRSIHGVTNVTEEVVILSHMS